MITNEAYSTETSAKDGGAIFQAIVSHNLSWEIKNGDTIFNQDKLQNYDVVLAMYHDQGLPVLKSQGFGEAINITLGLPFIRTSVDHRTALSLAGTGLAKSSSLQVAVDLALDLARH